MVQKGKNVTLYLPEDVYDPFKELCRKMGKTVRQHLAYLMRREIAGTDQMETPVDF